MKNSQMFLLLTMLFFSLFSCTKDEAPKLQIDELKGSVQKGPFLNGTFITLSELSSELDQTGRNFSSQIVNNRGTFSLQNIELSSNYVEVKADGFYFNEVSNTNSEAQLTLYAISDISDKSDLNVNVLSSLEKSRFEYLVAQGVEFSEAKKQAQQEILSIFQMGQSNMEESELLDISKSGDENAILLAISAILQGYRSTSDLSELLANISSDIREDGTLDDSNLETILINNAKLIKLNEIRSNLKARYTLLGEDVTIPDFEKYVNQFIQNTDFHFTEFIKYPESGKTGLNILDKEKTEYTGGNYSMTAELPKGSTLRVKISGKNWFFPYAQEDTGWNVGDWNDQDDSRIFSSTRIGNIDFAIKFEVHLDSVWARQINIMVYENEDIEPSWEKQITLK